MNTELFLALCYGRKAQTLIVVLKKKRFWYNVFEH